MSQIIQSPQMLGTNPHRLLFLDGLRGVAILMVVFFHAYSNRWANFLPYGDSYSHIKIFQFGNYGVQLFFMISGFVIAMTLEKCTTFWDFMYRRWLRLFPAMLIVSLLILVTAPLLTARPYGPPAFIDIIPGITFIEPEFYRNVFGYYQRILEGSFWSLFVEMKFYILAGFLYFKVGLKKMIATLIILFFSSILFEFLSPFLSKQLAKQLALTLHYLNYEHYGWFAAGALFYQYYTTKNWQYWLGAIFVALIAARCLGGLLSTSMFVATALVLIMALAMFNQYIQKILSAKWLVFVGFVSYPLYLLHENAMISIINQLNSTNSAIPDYFLSIIALIPIILLAWLISRFAEPMLRHAIQDIFRPAKLVKASGG